jgi:hypothetical protein
MVLPLVGRKNWMGVREFRNCSVGSVSLTAGVNLRLVALFVFSALSEEWRCDLDREPEFLSVGLGF